MTRRGSDVIAETLCNLGVEVVFGIVGIPVIEVAESIINHGIKFIGFRNEQSASYAASVYGYITKRPGVCLVVGGPGIIHALAGCENASINGWPMLLIAGSCESDLVYKGGFQELDQVSYLSPHTKFAGRPRELKLLPDIMELAYRRAYFGRPGPTYVDLPADIIQGSTSEIGTIPMMAAVDAPLSLGDPQTINKVANVLRSAKQPLLIIGKGAAYGRAEGSIRNFVKSTQIPFLPTPMGKGVVPDSWSTNMSACRTQALNSADVVILTGARLNWILHFGTKFSQKKEVKIIQIDIHCEEIGFNGGDASLGLCGDVGLIINQLSTELGGDWKSPKIPLELIEKRLSNEDKMDKQSMQMTRPLKYMNSYKIIKESLHQVVAKDKIVYISEGANTMDKARSAFDVEVPRHKLDAGTNATMGVGMGYAIAAAVAPEYKDCLIVAIEGDSAFGFSGMEIETAVRNHLHMIIVIMNNSGVYHGADESIYKSKKQVLPSTALSLKTKYHEFAESLGGVGFLVNTGQELERAIIKAAKNDCVNVVNVIIDPEANKKLEFAWMAKM